MVIVKKSDHKIGLVVVAIRLCKTNELISSEVFMAF